MKTQQVCKDFLRRKTGAVVDAMIASRMIQDEWGIVVDWHEMSYALDYLNRSLEATPTGVRHDGMIEYIIE